MTIQIKNRWTGAVLRTVEAESLRGANLSDANLRGAVLSDANLRGANLRGAVLSDAVLSDAVLSGAVLSDAVLRGANLRGAVLSDANLRGAVLQTGETWEVYRAEVVPALLAAGGRPVTPEAWRCHDWSNCLMACAFGADGIQGVPVLYRPRAEQLIQFFDAGLLDDLAPPMACVEAPEA